MFEKSNNSFKISQKIFQGASAFKETYFLSEFPIKKLTSNTFFFSDVSFTLILQPMTNSRVIALKVIILNRKKESILSYTA